MVGVQLSEVYTPKKSNERLVTVLGSNNQSTYLLLKPMQCIYVFLRWSGKYFISDDIKHTKSIITIVFTLLH